MRGIPIENDFTEDFISALIIKHRGRISRVADEMGVDRHCLYDYVDIHNLHDIVKKARYYKKEERNDDGETFLEYLMDQYLENPAIAFKTATYFLDTHGKDRGYGKTSNELPTELADQQLNDVKEQAKDYYEAKRKAT